MLGSEENGTEKKVLKRRREGTSARGIFGNGAGDTVRFVGLDEIQAICKLNSLTQPTGQ